MSSPTVVLLVDENDTDRASLSQALAASANEILTAADITEATNTLAGRTHVSAMIAGIPEADGQSIFDFRDRLAPQLGNFPCAFSSPSDMTAYYGRIRDGDKLFYKPVEVPALQEWLLGAAGPPAPPSQEEQLPSNLTTAVYAGAPSPTPQTPPPAAEGAPIVIEDYEEDLPIGTQLGDYVLERIIQKDNDFALYEAEQTSINRKVAIKTLYRKHRRDPAWVQAFVNEASARARVNHPNVSLVYECVQEHGVNFYTLELVDAPSIADLAAQRTNLSDDTLWGILESCCSALDYFRANQMQHRVITAQTILLQNGDQTRIANPVKSIGSLLSPDEEKQQMQYLGSALKPFIRKGSTEPGLYSIIDRLGEDRIDGIRSIGSLRRGINDDSANKTANLDSRLAEISEKETNKKAIVMGGLIGAILVVGGIAASLFLKKAPEIRNFDKFSHVPAGPFPYQDGANLELPDFWMAQQEVTIGQYAEFLEDIKSKPTTLEALRHPDQPESKTTYEPAKWNLMYDAALKGRKFLSGPINPNCPVMGVDWWDAYTYARWKKARLPTEQEWEKAARGRGGNVYPWGNEMDYSKFNSGIDQNDKGDQKAGSVDGFQYWSGVDALSPDLSRYGINGMAGNVSEWTASWIPHPDNPDKLVPVKRGASFATTDRFEMTSQRAAENAEERNFYTGFRIVSDIEPGSDPNYRPPPPERIVGATPSTSPAPKGDKGETGKGGAKGKSESPAPAPAPAPEPTASDWDPADGVDPFSTIFATDAKP